MASSIIALLAGGLYVILALIVTINIARSIHRSDEIYYDPTTDSYKTDAPSNLKRNVRSGAWAMSCLSFLNVPVCLVGLGLALVGLIAHRDRNHLFTWIGLTVNSMVILGVIGLYVLGALLGG
jgi:hypothetical protein